MKNIVVIGGGTGTFTLLSGLRKYPANISVIVSSADDGGSTGRLRKELEVFPPGDLRQCLVGLSAEEGLKELFNYRFRSGELKGHTAGNIILASLEKVLGLEAGIAVAAKMLKAKGQVLPVTLTPTTLSAVLANGKIIHGEHNIDEQDSSKHKAVSIKQLELKPNGPANPKALAAIKLADAIIFGPGDLYTSTIPNLLVKGLNAAVNKSKAKKILVTNIMTKFGQTDAFKASDFAKELEKYLKGKLDIVLANNQKPPQQALKKYAKEKAFFMETDIKNLAKMKVKTIAQNFLGNDIIKKQSGDKLKRSFIRHDSEKLAKLIWKLV